MRIIHSLEGHSWSGGQQQALFLAGEQARNGHEVLLICQPGSELSARACRQGISVCSHAYRGELNPISLTGLRRVFREFRPDVVNVHRAWAHTQWALISLLERFRGLIVTRRVLFRPDFNPLSLVKYRSASIRGFIAVSRAVKSRLQELGIPDRKIRVVFPATDTDRFCPDSNVFPARSAAERRPTLLTVANYHRNKGHHLILSAFEEIARRRDDATLLMAGLNTDRGECLSAIERHPFRDRISALGFQADVPALMNRSALFISASFEEGFPGTVREAMAMGLPVVLSDIPAHRELAELCPARLFAAGDAPGCASAALSVLAALPAPVERDRIRQLAIRSFSVTGMVQETLAVYRHFLGK
jgi:glycosyltransferase involved in cell wall biosynthesis